MEQLDLVVDLSYSKRPIRILDIMERVIHSKASRCARYSGVTTPKMKLHGSMKNSEQTIQKSSPTRLSLGPRFLLTG
jgi:hypothetical protein